LHRAIADNGYSVQLEVDGGIKADATARDSVGAGAGILVAGSAIFNREQSVAEAIGTLRGAISGMSPGNA
jgi:pentose-5-phosphate-3-epimerase